MSKKQRRAVARSTAKKARLAAAASLVGLALALPALGAPPEGRMSEQAAAHANGGGGAQKVDVIVVYEAMPDKAEHDRATRLGAEVRRAYGRFPMRAMRVPAKALHGLAKGKSVRHIALDEPVTANAKPAHKTAKLPEPSPARRISCS